MKSMEEGVQDARTAASMHPLWQEYVKVTLMFRGSQQALDSPFLLNQQMTESLISARRGALSTSIHILESSPFGFLNSGRTLAAVYWRKEAFP
jgi:hypothetical protein